jgi:hypothetical protein
MWYKLDDQGSVSSRDRDFPFHHHIQTGSGAHPATRVSFHFCKAAGPCEISFISFNNFLLQRLAEQIHERNENMKTEMLGKSQNGGMIVL